MGFHLRFGSFSFLNKNSFAQFSPEIEHRDVNSNSHKRFLNELGFVLVLDYECLNLHRNSHKKLPSDNQATKYLMLNVLEN